MRIALVVLFLVSSLPAAAYPRAQWPNEEIPVPELVRLYIAVECSRHARVAQGNVAACTAGELGGYRATVMMLTDPVLGEKAAARYRACAAGLGSHGGRFHRRRAECIGKSLNIKWRFNDDAPA